MTSWHLGRLIARLTILVGVLTMVIFPLSLWPAGASGVSTWHVERVVGNGEALIDVSCTGAENCVGVSIGSRQVALSNDGGERWRAVRGPRAAALGFTAVDCVAPATCMATTVLGSLSPSGGAVVKSRDGGRHWRVVFKRIKPNEPDYRLNDVSCINASSCLVTGTTGTKGFIFYTRNGGRTWMNAQLPQQPADGTINGVTCATRSRCLAAQGAMATIYRSDDGGRTWSPEVPPRAFTSYEKEKGVLTGINALSCGSGSFCVAGGFIAQTRLQGTTEPFKWVSRNGGASWNFAQPFAATGAKSPAAISVGAISCTSSLDCILGLSYGYIYSTNDGGVRWVRDTSAPRADSNVLSVARVAQHQYIASVISNMPSKKLFQGSLWVSH